MDAQDEGPEASAAPEDELAALLAPSGVTFRPGPTTSAPPPGGRRAPPPPDPMPDPPDRAAPAVEELGGTASRHGTEPATVRPPRPAAPPPAAPPAPAPRTEAPARPAPARAVPAAPPTTGTLGERVGVGRWFQPLPGGLLPRADPERPSVALLTAEPGMPVHAIASGTVRRVLPGVLGGGLELHVEGGGTFVYTGAATVVWTAGDDDDVEAGTILGMVTAGPGRERCELMVLLVGEDGYPLDPVDVLVGLPDPGELALRAQGGGLGVDPYELDLELRDAGTGGAP